MQLISTSGLASVAVTDHQLLLLQSLLYLWQAVNCHLVEPADMPSW